MTWDGDSWKTMGNHMGLSGNFTGKTDGLEGCLTRKPVFDRFSDRKLRKENFSG